MKPQSTQSYDVDNRYRFYKSLDSKSDISEKGEELDRVDDNSQKFFKKLYWSVKGHKFSKTNG